MRAAEKNQLVTESAAPYCSKLTARKLLNATIKQKKSYMNAQNLHEKYMLSLRTAEKTIVKRTGQSKKLK